MKSISGCRSRAQALATWLFSLGDTSLYSRASLWFLYAVGMLRR